MKGRPDLIKIELDNVLSVMADNPRSFSPEKHPVMYTFELIWQRIVKASNISHPGRMNVVKTDNTNCRLESYQRYNWLEKRVIMFILIRI
jgi:hypothetical protein